MFLFCKIKKNEGTSKHLWMELKGLTKEKNWNPHIREVFKSLPRPKKSQLQKTLLFNIFFARKISLLSCNSMCLWTFWGTLVESARMTCVYNLHESYVCVHISPMGNIQDLLIVSVEILRAYIKQVLWHTIYVYGHTTTARLNKWLLNLLGDTKLKWTKTWDR